VALQPLLGHSRIDTTQLYTDEIELDELAEALARALLSRNAQASPDLATLESDVAAALQSLEWRRRVRQGRTSAQLSDAAWRMRPSCYRGPR